MITLALPKSLSFILAHPSVPLMDFHAPGAAHNLMATSHEQISYHLHLVFFVLENP